MGSDTKKEKEVVWEGSSLVDLRAFPDDVKVNLGGELRRLQEGANPLDSKPMTTVGKGVYELRDRDTKGWYRVIYYTKVKNKIHVLHSFVKKSAKTPQKDLNRAEGRLKDLKARLEKEAKSGRK